MKEERQEMQLVTKDFSSKQQIKNINMLKASENRSKWLNEKM